MKAPLFVSTLRSILDERQTQYGDTIPMLEAIAARWSLTLKRPITPQQVALCMMDLKLARLNRSPRHLDSLMDVAGYAACLAELIGAYKD
jgi:hypothetical protein